MPNSIVRPDLFWGKSRSGKTTNIGLTAQYIREKYGLKSRLVIAEGEGVENIQSLIDDGTIDLLTMTRDGRFLLEQLTQLVIGWWPPDPQKPNILQPTPPERWKDIGYYAFESLTSLCDCCMSYQTADKSVQTVAQGGMVGKPEAKMLSTGQDTYVQDGSMKWRFAGLGDYGFIQRRAEEWVKSSARLGFHGVKKITWSALEAKGVDEKKAPCYGPDLIGSAATGKAPAWFGIMAHFSYTNKEIMVDDPTERGAKLKLTVAKRLMYLTPHVEPDDAYKLPCLAGVRAPIEIADKIPPVMEPNVRKLYELLDSLTNNSKGG